MAIDLTNLLEAASSGLPLTRTRTSHGFTLHAAYQGRAPRIIGALQSVHFGQSRPVDDEFEVEANATGLPIDQVPQTLSRREISFDRFDTFSTILEEIFGGAELIMLIDQAHPLAIREVWKDPSGLLTTTTRAYQYNNVYMVDFDRQMSSTDSRIVGTKVVFKYRNRIRVI